MRVFMFHLMPYQYMDMTARDRYGSAWVTLPNTLSLPNGMLLLKDSSRTNYAARYYRILEH